MTSLRRRLPRRDDDSGAYAILFGMLVVVLVGIVAFALDLALVRESRASNRSLSDSAVVAAAGSLRDGTGRWAPLSACQMAWSYLGPHVPGSGTSPTGSASCGSASPTAFTDGVTVCPTTMSTATWTKGDWRVVVTWPVPRYSTGATPNPLLNQPDTRPARPTQAFDSAMDGSDAGCDRMAVQVFQSNKLGLSGIFGVSSVTASATSVGRSVVTGQSGDVLAALNILETTDCVALSTNGNGSAITVGSATSTVPGIIGIDSDGKGSCTSSQHVVDTGAGAIKALGAAGTTPLIQILAMTDNAAKAYATADVSGGRLAPAPTVLSQRVTRSPVDSVYNCSASSVPAERRCTAANSPLETLKAAYGGISFTSSSAATTAGWTYYAPGRNNQGRCTTPNAGDTVVGQKVFIDCPGGLTVSGPLVFSTAKAVVSNGSISVSICMAINIDGVTGCPTTIAGADAGGAPSRDAVLYLQAGNLSSSTARVILRNTFVYLADGYSDFQSGSTSGLLYLTAPQGKGCATDACSNQAFNKVAFWSEKVSSGYTASANAFTFSGGAALKLRGVIFVPNGYTNLNGQSSDQQDFAQFWTRRLQAVGGAEVRMQVDPSAAVARPAYGGALIR